MVTIDQSQSIVKTEESLIPYQRSQGQLPLTNQGLLSEDILNKNSSDTELAEWFNEKFAGFWSLYFPVAASVSYLFFFGIGGYLHVRTIIYINKVTVRCLFVSINLNQ